MQNTSEHQLLYEHWLKKELWLLRGEGLPLLLGLHPTEGTDAIDPTLSEQLSTLWEHARQCVQKRLLQVSDPTLPPEQWQVEPLALYRWAVVSGCSMPQELTNLAEFIMRTIPSSTTAMDDTLPQQNAEAEYLIDEQRKVLAAAFCLLANHRDRCGTAEHQVDVKRLVTLISEDPGHWLNSPSPALSDAAMEELLQRTLRQG